MHQPLGGVTIPESATDDLVGSAQRGDQHARRRLVERYLPVIYGYVSGALSAQETDDVVQEVFLRALANMSTLRNPAGFEPWLIGIAVNLVRDRLRRPSREEPVGLDLAGRSSDSVERIAVGRALADSQRREVARALGWLDPEQRDLLDLWRLELDGQLGREAIVATLETTPAAVRIRLLRMREQLDSCRALVRVLVVRGNGCVDLAALLKTWDGRPDPLHRKRFVRHIRGCPSCAPLTEGLLAADLLLTRVAPVVVPVGLLDGVLAGLAAKPIALAVAAPVGAVVRDGIIAWLSGAKIAAVAAAAAVAGAVVIAVPHLQAPAHHPVVAAPRPTRAISAPVSPAASPVAAAAPSASPSAPASPSPRVDAAGPTLAIGDVVADMTQPQDAAPHGVPSYWDWASGPVAGAGNPSGSRALSFEGEVYECATGNPAGNARVELRNVRAWVRSARTGAWRLVNNGSEVNGSAFLEDYSVNPGISGRERAESDGNTSVQPGGGRNFLFWAPDRVSIDPTDEAGIISTVQARLVLDNPTRRDDRASACLILSMGGSYWASVDTPPDRGVARAFAHGRFKRITGDWQNFSATSLRPTVLQAARPSLS